MSKPALEDLFENRVTFPDPSAKSRLSRLVGLDDYQNRIAKILGVQVNPSGLETWIRQTYGQANNLIKILSSRSPLVIFAGDIGSGKTELAECIGDTVARNEKIDVTLFPLSLSSRGQGRVGEMTQLLTAAIDHTISESTKLKSSAPNGKARGGIILLIDEADALAQSREASQMHHEDKAGVNALIRGVSRIANANVPAAIIMCTNRIDALDPAVKRRAAEILIFERPTTQQREAVLAPPLKELNFTPSDIEKIVKITGPQNGVSYGFTFSDLTQRLLPRIIFDAYPEKTVSAARAIEIAGSIIPTPPFKEIPK